MSIIAAVSISTTEFIIIELFPQAIIHLFNKENVALFTIGSSGMRIYLSMLPIVSFQVVGSNYFETVNKAKKSIFLSLSRQVIILIPLIIILLIFLQLNGVWIVGASSDLIASLLTAYFIWDEMKKLKSIETKPILEKMLK